MNIFSSLLDLISGLNIFQSDNQGRVVPTIKDLTPEDLMYRQPDKPITIGMLPNGRPDPTVWIQNMPYAPKTGTDFNNPETWMQRLPFDANKTNIHVTKSPLLDQIVKLAKERPAISYADPAAHDPEAQQAFKNMYVQPQNPNYGLREDGSQKGNGWLGPIKRSDGKIMTELSTTVNIGGEERLIPILVPTLSPAEITYLRNGNKPTKQIIGKAIIHAIDMIKLGQNPFNDSRR